MTKTPHIDPRRALMQRILRLLGCQRGAVLTEFVITLPVWLIVFIGIAELNQVERGANRALIEANHAMWVTSDDVIHSSPRSKWGSPHQISTTIPKPDGTDCDQQRYPDCADFDWNNFQRLNNYGTFGEAISAANEDEVKHWAYRSEVQQQADANGSPDLRMYDTMYSANDYWAYYALKVTWDRYHEGDPAQMIPMLSPYAAYARTYFRSIPNGGILGGPTMSPFATAAGTRYGIVKGENTQTVNGLSMTGKFQTYAGPRPMDTDAEGYFTTGAPRLLTGGTGFDRIPGFEWAPRLGGIDFAHLGD